MNEYRSLLHPCYSFVGEVEWMHFIYFLLAMKSCMYLWLNLLLKKWHRQPRVKILFFLDDYLGGINSSLDEKPDLHTPVNVLEMVVQTQLCIRFTYMCISLGHLYVIQRFNFIHLSEWFCR